MLCNCLPGPTNAGKTARSRSSFKLAKSYTPIYTGGAFAASADGARLYTTLNEDVVLTEVESGERLHLFQGVSSRQPIFSANLEKQPGMAVKSNSGLTDSIFPIFRTHPQSLRSQFRPKTLLLPEHCL